jgi:hypothetical protein
VTSAEKKRIVASLKKKELLRLANTLSEMRDDISDLLPDAIAAARQLSEAVQSIRNASIIL